MASLKEAARYVYEDAKDAIAWIAVWKTGKSWHSKEFYDIEYSEPSRFIARDKWGWDIDPDIIEELEKIVEEDPDARLMNPYYSNMGPLEDMTMGTLMAGIQFQYSLGGNIVGIIKEAKGGI